MMCRTRHAKATNTTQKGERKMHSIIWLLFWLAVIGIMVLIANEDKLIEIEQRVFKK